MGVLDPTTPWPYLLYILAGAAVVAITLPKGVEALDQASRDVFLAHPGIQAFAATVFWTLWPLLFGLLVLSWIAGVLLWLSERKK